jgi:hypothetical protein
MPRITLEDFRHAPNAHCSSTSIRDILRFDNQEFSEATIFGLGGGLGFFYFSDAALNPSRRFNGRADDLESKFYRLLGSPLDWKGRWDAAWMANTLANGRPLLAQTDIAYLPHYQGAPGEVVHFPLHGVVIAGIDTDSGVAYIADTFSADLLPVPFDNLKAALIGEGCPMMRPFNIAEACVVEVSVTEELIAQAIRTAVEEMLNPNRRELGIGAMRRLAGDLQRWHESPDWAWCARFAYQSIEKRGTGGGGFRSLYADFLNQAEGRISELKRIQAESRMREAAQHWTGLADLCKTAFVEQEPGLLSDAGLLVSAIARHEENLLRDMSDAVRPLL